MIINNYSDKQDLLVGAFYKVNNSVKGWIEGFDGDVVLFRCLNSEYIERLKACNDFKLIAKKG